MSGAENDQILYDLASVMPWNCRNNIVQNQIQKNNKKSKKTLAFFRMVVYTLNCCDIDSNEARGCCHRDGRFSVERMSSLKTDDKSLYKFRRPSRDGVCGKKLKDTHGDVYSRRLSYCLKSTNRRRLFLWQIR